MSEGAAQTTLHASCVSVNDRAVLITGTSGAGKSALALQLMAFGATLVADDRTLITRQNDLLIARSPDSIAGLIEARGVGILQCDHAEDVPVALMVNLDRVETDRLPVIRHHRLLNLSIPLLHKVDAPHFSAAIMAYLRGKQREPDGTVHKAN